MPVNQHHLASMGRKPYETLALASSQPGTAAPFLRLRLLARLRDSGHGVCDCQVWLLVMHAPLRCGWCKTAQVCHGSLPSLKAWQTGLALDTSRVGASIFSRPIASEQRSRMHAQSQQLLSVAPM